MEGNIGRAMPRHGRGGVSVILQVAQLLIQACAPRPRRYRDADRTSLSARIGFRGRLSQTRELIAFFDHSCPVARDSRGRIRHHRGLFLSGRITKFVRHRRTPILKYNNRRRCGSWVGLFQTRHSIAAASFERQTAQVPAHVVVNDSSLRNFPVKWVVNAAPRWTIGDEKSPGSPLLASSQREPRHAHMEFTPEVYLSCPNPMENMRSWRGRCLKSRGHYIRVRAEWPPSIANPALAPVFENTWSRAGPAALHRMCFRFAGNPCFTALELRGDGLSGRADERDRDSHRSRA